MSAIADNRIRWTYTDDAGQDWAVNAILGYTSQDKLGGSAATISVPVKPPSIKMRRLSVRNATLGRTRTVPIYSGDAPILVSEATVMLNEWVTGALNSYEFTNDQTTPVSIIPERHPRKSPVTSQAT